MNNKLIFNTKSLLPLCLFFFISVGAWFFALPSFYYLNIALILFVTTIFLFTNFKYRYNTKNKIIFICLTLMIFIDKYNDFLLSYNMKHILSVAYGLILLLFLLSIQSNQRKKFWKYFYISIISTIIIYIIAFSIKGNLSLFSTYNRESSLAIVIFLMLTFFKSKKMFLLFLIPITCATWYLFEARTATGAIIFFLLTTIFVSRVEKKSTISILLTIYIILLATIIYGAIYYEFFFIQDYTSTFTGRGLLWYHTLNELYNQGYLLFGFSNDPSNTKKLFIDTYLGYINYVRPEWYQKHIYTILESANTHNGYIQIIYGSGIIGLSLFIFTLYYAIFRRLLNKENIILLIVLFFMYSFYGKSLYGTSLIGFSILSALFVPFENNKTKSSPLIS